LVLDAIALIYKTINSDQSAEAASPILAMHRVLAPEELS
jgi:hypothetical protein